MYLQQSLPTIREDVMFEELDEVQDKYFGRSQNKIVQGMTAKEKRPGSLIEKDNRSKWDVKSIRLSSIGKDNTLQNDQDIEDIMAKERRACLHGKKVKRTKSISLCVIKEDDDLNVVLKEEDIDIIAKEKETCLLGEKKKNTMSLSLSMIEEDEDQEAEEAQEDNKMLSVSETEFLSENSGRRLDMTEGKTISAAQSITRAPTPMPTWGTQISAFVPKETILSSENIYLTKSLDMLTTEHTEENVGFATEENSRIRRLQDLLDILEVEIKRKSVFLSAHQEMALEDWEYKNQLREIYRKSTQSNGDLKREKTQSKIENKPGHGKNQTDPKEEKIDSDMARRQKRVHSDQVVYEILKILDKSQTQQGYLQNSEKEKSNPKQKKNASLKKTRSGQQCGAKSTANQQKKRQKQKESKEIAALYSESPYAENMRCKGVHLPPMKLSPHQKGEPIFPSPQSKNVCKLPPIQGSKKTSSPALIVPAVLERRQTPRGTLSPVVPRTPSRQESRPACAARVPASPVPQQVSPGLVIPASGQCMSRSGTGTPSTPPIRSPLMIIPTTSQDIRKCFKARKASNKK